MLPTILISPPKEALLKLDVVSVKADEKLLSSVSVRRIHG